MKRIIVLSFVVIIRLLGVASNSDAQQTAASTTTTPTGQSANCGWGPDMRYAPAAIRQYVALLPQAALKEPLPCELLLSLVRPTSLQMPSYLFQDPLAGSGFWGSQYSAVSGYPTQGFGAYGYGYPYGVMLQEGAIKTSRDVKGTDLWINGCYAGAAGAFDSWWNQKLAAHAGEMLIVTVRRIKDNKSYDTPTKLTSEWLNRYVGARHLPFSVNHEDLDRGEAFNRQAATVSCADSSIR